MSFKCSLLVLGLGAALFSASGALADNDIDLPVNGDFRGAPSGYSPAPGWTLTPDGGGARILPGGDADEFALELQATPGKSQSVVSTSFQLVGGQLKLEFKVRGTGSASAGYELLDAAGQTVVAADRRVIAASPYDQEYKLYFQMPAVNARFIRIRLTAEAGSAVCFRDVDADMYPGAVAPAAQPGVISAPPAAPAPAAQPGVIAAPAPAATPAPATVAAPAPAATPAPATVAAPAPAVQYQAAPAPTAVPPSAQLLQNDRYYTYTFLDNDTHFEASVPCGSDIDFKIGEDASSQLYWRLVSYNPAVCRVKLEHDSDGVFPFRIDKAEIELKALMPGKTDVVFVCGPKKVTVHFTAL